LIVNGQGQEKKRRQKNLPPRRSGGHAGPRHAQLPGRVGEHFMGFVNTQVKEGRYSNASDVMRAALRLLEEREANLTALRAALIEGEESGPSTPFDFEAFIARKRNEKPKTQ
jgi:antitoxin ParD1/3/4